VGWQGEESRETTVLNALLSISPVAGLQNTEIKNRSALGRALQIARQQRQQIDVHAAVHPFL
jgi:hypothetical protein